MKQVWYFLRNLFYINAIVLMNIARIILWPIVNLHKLLYRIPWYRVAHAHLVYPLTCVLVDKDYSRMTRHERLRAWSRYMTSEHWSLNYRIGKKLSNRILKRWVDNGTIQHHLRA